MNLDIYVKFIKSITENEIKFIAERDYGADTEKHEYELRKLIFDQNGVISSNQYWYPYEVVELCRWSYEIGHEREFVICNIIICLSVIAGTDNKNDPEYMKEVLKKEYDKLDSSNYDLIFKILTETIKAQEKSS